MQDYLETRTARYRKVVSTLSQEQIFKYLRLREQGYMALYAMAQVRNEPHRFTWRRPQNGKSALYATIKAGSLIAILRLLHDDKYNPVPPRGKFSSKAREMERRKASLIVPESHKDNSINRYFLPRVPVDLQRVDYSRAGYSKHNAYNMARKNAIQAMRESTGASVVNGYYVKIIIRDAIDSEYANGAIIAENESCHIELKYAFEEHIDEINELAYIAFIECIGIANENLRRLREVTEKDLKTLENEV